MATAASLFSVFMIYALVFTTMTDGDLQIKVQPSEILWDATSSLNINCSFSQVDHPEMEEFVSLILSKSNSSGQSVQELAAVTQFSPDSVTVLTQEKVTATGVHSQTGESFLSVTWEYPKAAQAGIYQCVAHGLDILGHTLETVNSSEVTFAEADVYEVFATFRQMVIDMENKMSDMENTIINMDKHIQALEFNNSQMSSHINTLSSLLRSQGLYLIGTYKNNKYYISKEVFTNIGNAMNMCKSYGGQLVEVDDEDEFLAIQSFLDHTLTDDPYIMIAGTDEFVEGNWVFQSTNQSLPYISWASGEPNGGTSNNCLNFYFYQNTWKMADYPCEIRRPDVFTMCEAEIL